MKNKVQEDTYKRKIISATINEGYIIWIEDLANRKNIPKSRLLEEGIKLLKKSYEKSAEQKLEDEINEGIDSMLLENECMSDMADSSFSSRVGEELL